MCEKKTSIDEMQWNWMQNTYFHFQELLQLTTSHIICLFACLLESGTANFISSRKVIVLIVHACCSSRYVGWERQILLFLLNIWISILI